MTNLIGRRKLIGRGLMAGTGLVVFSQLDGLARPMFAATNFQRDFADRKSVV